MQDPLLFAGCRNGMCYMWDIRLAPSPIITIREPVVGTATVSSIIGLHPLHDYNYVISNALNSNVGGTSPAWGRCQWCRSLSNYSFPCGT